MQGRNYDFKGRKTPKRGGGTRRKKRNEKEVETRIHRRKKETRFENEKINASVIRKESKKKRNDGC